MLDEEWTPDTIQGRDEEIATYHEHLQPVINGWQPRNIFVYGKTGVGKTVVTESLLADLAEGAEAYDVSLSIVMITCDNQSTSYQVAVKLLNQLYRQRGKQPVPTTGYSQQDIFGKLWTEIDDIGGTILFVMDEIDNIENPDDILYQIPRARKNNYVEDARLGIIAISNDYSFTEDLSPKAKSTLRETELHFTAYEAHELVDILSHRAEKAFHDGVIEDGVIQRIGALAAKDAGDARMAIDLLLEAGEAAVRTDASTVGEADVVNAQERLESNWVANALKGISTQEQLALAAVFTNDCETSKPARTTELYDRYCALCEEQAREPSSSRQMRDHLNELAFQNVLKKQEMNRGAEGGRYYEFTVEPAVEALLSAANRVESRVFDKMFVRKWTRTAIKNRRADADRLEFISASEV